MSAEDFSSIAAVLLAAGSSRRFGKRNKLLEPIDGEALVRRTAHKILDAGVGNLWVVTGCDAKTVAESLDGLPCTFVENARYEKGMGSSLACGIAAIRGGDFAGVLVCLSDLPELESDDVRSVARTFLKADASRIVQPVFEGKRGHPVCFPKRCWKELGSVSGDQGARKVIEGDLFPVLTVGRTNRGCIYDLDTDSPR